jgi:hypothetical protein
MGSHRFAILKYAKIRQKIMQNPGTIIGMEGTVAELKKIM